MSEQHDPFSPQHVDESVEQLSAANQFDPHFHTEPGARLVRDVQRLYGLERKQYLRALQRVQDRLVAQRIPTEEQPTAPLELGQLWTPQKINAPGSLHTRGNRPAFDSLEHEQPWTYPETDPQGSTYTSGKKPYSSTRLARFGRRANLLVAMLVMIVLVGSLLFVLREIRPNILVGTSQVSTATPSSSPISYTPGQVLYTRSSNSSVMSVAWSPDSQRIATLSYSGVQIWDATTGGNVVNVQLPPDIVIRAMAWSPDGKWIAIGIDTAIVIADTHTGKLVHQFPLSALAESAPTTNSPYLATLLPASGGQGVSLVTNLAWSPDGRLLVVNMDGKTPAERRFSLLNAQTGAFVYRFSATDSYLLGPAVWSASGKYLAAVGLSLSTIGLKQMLVWNASTYQIVVKHNVSGEEIDTNYVPAWQPGSDNLAFLDYQKAGTSITLWDVANNTLVKRYTTLGDQLSWSSDGKYLAVRAYASTHIPNQVVVLDARSGHQVYTFHTKHLSQIAVMAWSPDGKYIVSGEGTNAGGATIAEVWVAPQA